MSDANLNGIWRGYLSGTNRGPIVIRFKQQGNALRARAALFDFQFGPALASLKGSLDGGKIKLRLMSFQARAPVNPLDGEIDLTFNESFDAGEGVWKTDVGTNGICKIYRTREIGLRWYRLWYRTKLHWFYFRWRRHVYVMAMAAVAYAAMTDLVHLTGAILVLLLLPAPFVFSHQLKQLVEIARNAKIRKIGPLEFDQNAPTAEITAAAHRQAEENQKFIQLNAFFVMRTKLMAIALAHANASRMTIADFTNTALSFGVPANNVEQTIAALVAAQCAQLDGGNIFATDWGKQYVQRGVRLA